MELRDYFRIFRKSWILILGGTLLGAACAAGYSIITPAKYVASTQLYVSVQPAANASVSELAQGTSFARQAVTTYVDLVNKAVVLDPVIKELKLELSTADLAPTIAASSPLNTTLIDISVTNNDPEFAAKIANSVGKNFSRIVVDQLDKPIGANAVSSVKIVTTQPALAPGKQSSPNVQFNIGLGLLIGIVVGIGSAVLRDLLHTQRPKSPRP